MKSVISGDGAESVRTGSRTDRRPRRRRRDRSGGQCRKSGRLAVKLLRRGGVVNFFGGCPNGSRIELDTNLLHYSEMTCKASFHHTPRA